MKTILLSALILIVVTCTANAADVVIGISPWLTTAQRENIHGALANFVLKDAHGGTNLVIYDAWNLREIAHISVPSLQTDIKAARAMRLKKEMSALADWFKAGADGPLAGTGALRTPEWFEEISPQRTAVLLIGSPLYPSPTEPAFAMTGRRYPTDGHLACTLAESVYGIAQKHDRLTQTTVHWVIPYLGVWENELHRERITRFWILWFQGQGGTLATMTVDFASALRRVVQENLPAIASYRPETDEPKPEMRTADPRVVPDWIQALPTPPAEHSTPATMPATPAPSLTTLVESTPTLAPAPAPVPPPEPPAAIEPPAPVSVPPPSVAVVTTPVVSPEVPVTPTRKEPVLPVNLPAGDGKTFIGICWSERIDLDLHVQPRPQSKELCWIATQQRSADGRFDHDYQSGTRNREYEYVELVTALEPTCRVTVNYYAGKVPSPTFQVFVRHAGHTYLRTYVMPAAKGNRRGDANAREKSPFWVVVDLHELMNSGSETH